MELEELTKTQIILLVLLVSFVTSIATGIVTVSLLAQAPPAVTQTVNHIIERTVQAVAPVANGPATTKETTVVVKEDDLITKSVAASFSRIGRIHADSATTSPIVGVGELTSNSTMVTDASAVSGTHDVTIAGVDFLFVVSKTYPDIGVAFMTATGTPPAGGPTATPFKIADAGSLQLGQTLLGLYGEKQDRVGMTILSSASKLATLKSGDKSITVRTIDTGLDVPTPGAPLVTVFGDLAGISTDVSRISAKGSYVAMSDIMNAIAAGQVKGDATTTVAVQ